ncbi:chalcone isomerase family protein [Undibacterium rugosum]|uniref:chalcone isomerase family protein n=1 Tax=Undibacterium rugosum TaxID=2762291 RepID=UPI001B81F077|nr:chalcone isomerase family protein [Undibacterium rugosum]MBR7779137.1 chalcone isomerase family protein [Undibacterium rugosum]
MKPQVIQARRPASQLRWLQTGLLLLSCFSPLYASSQTQAQIQAQSPAQTQSESAAPHIQQELGKARLSGSGGYRWFGLAIYQASLWTGPEGWRPDLKRYALDLRYARSLVGKKIAQASLDEMEKLQVGTPEKRQQWLATMQQIFPDVKEGTHITGIYDGASGARFYLDGKLLAEVRDADFAQAFFAIWLHPNTSAPALRKQLLAGSGTSAGYSTGTAP